MSSATTGTLGEGDIVDAKYRIVRFLGKGAWASVYEGVNIRIGRRVAIKVLLDEAIQKPGILERFEREAQAATRIESDHVVGVFDVGELGDGRPYMVMELLEGEDLAQRIAKKGALSQDRAVHYVVQALCGLHDAHAAGVMHRDIKPENIVLVRTKHNEEVVKIVDFGISKLHGSAAKMTPNMTQTNAILGSPAYMSPEQCRGTRHMDHRSDLYSIGVVLYELLTAHLPHKAETFNELMFQIALEDVKSPAVHKPDLDPDLCAIVLKSLAREPGERFQAATEFEAELLKWAQSRGHHTESWTGRRTRGFVRTLDETGNLTGTSERPPTTDPAIVSAIPAAPSSDPAIPLADTVSQPSAPGRKSDLTATTAAPVASVSTRDLADAAARPRRQRQMYIAIGALSILGIGGAIWGMARTPPTTTGLVGSGSATSAAGGATPTLAAASSTPPADTAPAASTEPQAVVDAAPATSASSTAVVVRTKPNVPNRPLVPVVPSATVAAASATVTAPAASASAKTTVDGRTIRTNF